jgi:hypothetical protein
MTRSRVCAERLSKPMRNGEVARPERGISATILRGLMGKLYETKDFLLFFVYIHTYPSVTKSVF